MSITEADFAAHLCEWCRSHPALREPVLHTRTLERAQEPPFDSGAPCLRRVSQAS